jgi:hypothetical protein
VRDGLSFARWRYDNNGPVSPDTVNPPTKAKEKIANTITARKILLQFPLGKGKEGDLALSKPEVIASRSVPTVTLQAEVRSPFRPARLDGALLRRPEERN